MNTRSDRVERDIERKELMLPSGFGVKLLAECLACGVLVGVGLLLGPLTIAAFAVDGHAPWFWPAIGAFSLLIALLMFVYIRRNVREIMAEFDQG